MEEKGARPKGQGRKGDGIRGLAGNAYCLGIVGVAAICLLLLLLWSALALLLQLSPS